MAGRLADQGIHKMTRRIMRRLTVILIKGDPEVFEGDYQMAEEMHFVRVQAVINNVKTTKLFPYQNIQQIKVMDVPEEES